MQVDGWLATALERDASSNLTVSSLGYEGILVRYINTDFPHDLNETEQLLKQRLERLQIAHGSLCQKQWLHGTLLVEINI